MTRVTVEVKKSSNDTNLSLFKKFQRRVNEAGIIPAVKSKRFRERPESAASRKAWALKKIARQKEIARLRKLGKIQ